MMSASEFFDCGAEPPWLVDACEGEVVSPNSEFEFSYHAGVSPSVPFLGLNQSNEAGPSNSVLLMDLDEVACPNNPHFANNPDKERERFLLGAGVQSVRQPMALTLEQQGSWLSTVTANVPNQVSTRRLAPAPAPDLLFRACKKRKRSHA